MSLKSGLYHIEWSTCHCTMECLFYHPKSTMEIEDLGRRGIRSSSPDAVVVLQVCFDSDGDSRSHMFSIFSRSPYILLCSHATRLCM